MSQLTNLSSALIRAWEARYGIVVPERTPSGYRLYSDEDVLVLRGAQRLVQQGMAPMQVAALERSYLQEMGRPQPGEAPPPSPPRTPAPRREPPLKPEGALFSERVDNIVDAFAQFDSARVEQFLGPPLAVLPPDVACEHLLLPLLYEVGERWHSGELSVAAEHFGSNVIRTKLLLLLDTLRHKGANRERVMCACPPGELHELGLMMFAVRASLQGWDPLYLGQNVPVAELAEVQRRTAARVVALSWVQLMEAPALLSRLREVRAALAPTALVLVGGRGVVGLEEVVRQAGCHTLPASGQLDDLLAASEDSDRGHPQ